MLDLPCGTGQSLDGLAQAVGPHGLVVGVDLSQGMIRRAQDRVLERGLDRVKLLTADVHSLTREALGRATAIDRVHVFLGLSTFPRWTHAFEALWGMLEPGGRCVLVDVYSERRGLYGRLVNLIGQADTRRRFWEPLERVAVDFERVALPYDVLHGGAILLATGIKPPRT